SLPAIRGAATRCTLSRVTHPPVPSMPVRSELPETPSGCTVRATGLDFETKAERDLDVREVAQAMRDGLFVWVDVDFVEHAGTRALLSGLGLIASEIVDD